MSVILLLSVLTGAAALTWAFIAWRRLRDWRVLPPSLLLLVLVGIQAASLLEHLKRPEAALTWNPGLWEWAGLDASLLGLLSLIFFERMILRERSRALRLAKEVRTRRRIERENKRVSRKLRLVNDIADRLATGSSSEEIVDAGVEGLFELFPGERVAYSAIRAGVLRVVSSRQPRGMVSLKGVRTDLSRVPDYYRKLVSGEIVVVEDVQQEPLLVNLLELFEDSQTRALLDVPVKNDDGLVGLICVDAPRRREWTKDEIGLLSELARYLAIAVRQARAQEERRRIEADLLLRNHAIEESKAGVIITKTVESDFSIIYVNQGFEELTGYSREEVVGRNCRFLQGLETSEEAREEIREALRKKIPVRTEIINYRKDGSRFLNEISISPVRDREGRVTHFIGLQTDVTESRNLQGQLAQAQKMEAVGQLTGGIAHDFNNLLAVMLGNVELVRESLAEDGKTAELLDQAILAASRGKGLTQHLLAFSRKQTLQPRALRMDKMLSGWLLKLLRRALPENIRLEVEDQSRWPLRADPAQLESALLNLVVNARDAMPKGGRLTIRTRDLSLDQESAKSYSQLVPGDYVAVEVDDSGVGIPPHVLERIFEPFYTTKSPGSGTGLGLSMVHGFVQQSGGEVRVRSKLGRGTCIELYFPRAMAEAEDKEPEAELGQEYMQHLGRGGARILVVEDEPHVRRLASALLQCLGHRVETAGDGQAALNLLGDCGQWDLLLTDMVLPGEFNGLELAARARRQCAEIKVLYMTGYVDLDPDQQEALQDACLLHKPFSKNDLARMVSRALGEPAPSLPSQGS